MSSTSAAAWKTFRDELTQCFVYEHSYKKPELLKGRLVVDLARRLPNFAKQRSLNYLSDRCGSTCDPCQYVGSVVEWLKRRACDQHGLGSKPTRAILLCPWERHFTAHSPAWWSWQAVLNYSNISIKL